MVNPGTRNPELYYIYAINRPKASFTHYLKKLGTFILFLAFAGLTGQNGGQRAFSFLDVPVTARAAALGGSGMSIWSNDINLVNSNPALLNPSMTRQVALNHANYVSDIKLWYAGYGHDLGKFGTTAIGVQAFDYGKFKGYDESGVYTADFRAADYAISLSYARPMADSMFNIGISLKTLVSQYETYSAVGNALDFGVTWRDKNNLVLSLLARNVGIVWKSLTPGNQKQSLPNTVQFGVSKKVDKAPFRLFAVYDQLLKWNLRYISPLDTGNTTSSFGDNQPRDSTGTQRFFKRFGTHAGNFMRHVTIGTEIILSNNFHLTVAYNYRRQREMILPERRGMNGFSFGVNFRIKRFGFAYSFSKLAFPGNSSVFAVTFAW